MVIESNESNEIIQVDAVHPLFKGYKIAVDEVSSTDDDLRYHCKECLKYFPKEIRFVQRHIKSSDHTPIDKCVYCHGPVYEYWYNSERLIYHSCAETRHSTVS